MVLTGSKAEKEAVNVTHLVQGDYGFASHLLCEPLCDRLVLIAAGLVQRRLTVLVIIAANRHVNRSKKNHIYDKM